MFDSVIKPKLWGKQTFGVGLMEAILKFKMDAARGAS
jgi:hypothetical protein